MSLREKKFGDNTRPLLQHREQTRLFFFEQILLLFYTLTIVICYIVHNYCYITRIRDVRKTKIECTEVVTIDVLVFIIRTRYYNVLTIYAVIRQAC